MRPYAETLAMVGFAVLAGLLIEPRWGTAPADMLFLPAVLAAATLHGRRPALVAALLSGLAYNYFFTEPLHSVRIDDPTDVVVVTVLFLVALVTSQLAGTIREKSRLAAAHAARNATIAGLARKLLSCSSEEQNGQVACRQLFELLHCNAVLIGAGPDPAMIASYPPDPALTSNDLNAAASTLESGEPAGRGTTRHRPADWLFVPVRVDERTIAAMGLARDDGLPPIAREHWPLLDNLLDQVALALERARLEAESREVAELRERDRLRSALLSSVGHDLRTPLTAIIAAATEMRRSRYADDALVATVGSEATKLERYIANLLDMARIEAGAIRLKTEPVDLVDAVAAAARDVRRSLDGHHLEVDVPADLPLVRADPQLLHHCLINILDNAGRHSGEGSPIYIRGRLTNGAVLLSVEDEGRGLPETYRQGTDMIETLSGSDRKGGARLGLTIVQAFANAMGAEVTATNRPEGQGANFTMRFPGALTLEPANPYDVS